MAKIKRSEQNLRIFFNVLFMIMLMICIVLIEPQAGFAANFKLVFSPARLSSCELFKAVLGASGDKSFCGRKAPYLHEERRASPLYACVFHDEPSFKERKNYKGQVSFQLKSEDSDQSVNLSAGQSSCMKATGRVKRGDQILLSVIPRRGASYHLTFHTKHPDKFVNEMPTNLNGPPYKYTDLLWRKDTNRISRLGYTGFWPSSSWTSYVGFCPSGSWAVGYSMQVEERQGSGDDTALNNVRLYCADKKGLLVDSHVRTAKSNAGDWGEWSDPSVFCPNNEYLTDFQLKVEYGTPADGTSVNSVRFKCNKGDFVNRKVIEAGNGGPWGRWVYWQRAPKLSGICGLRGNIQSRQGGRKDDLALTDLQIYWCQRSKLSPKVVN